MGVAASIIGAVAFTVFISCTTMTNLVVTAPEIPGATFVGDEQCAMCHEDVVKAYKFTTHARLQVIGAETQGVSGCESCHGAGSKHADDGTGKFIVNPGKSAEACFRCHQDKQAEFNLPYHHPVAEGKMSCNDCHDPHGQDIKKSKKLLMASTNDSCLQCHREQARQHIWEHEALREGCTSCHAVHGSINKKMLVENDNNLCLKCHTQVQATSAGTSIGGSSHGTRINNATCWSAGCHAAVHGSNINAHLRY
jgi:predicted CXXCH cytochrome family protein